MKKIIPMILLILSMAHYFSEDCRAQEAQGDARAVSNVGTPDPWQRLAKFGPLQIIFTPPRENDKGYTLTDSPGTLQTLQPTKVMRAYMEPIKQALESAGIREPVTLQLQTGNDSQPLVQPGTFTPTVKDGSVNFPIPTIMEVTLLKENYKKLLLYRLRHDLLLNVPEACNLLFKDSQGNIRAEVKVDGYFSFKYEDPQYEKLARFLAKEQYKNAEEFCAKMKKEMQTEGYRITGDAFLEKQDYPQAGLYYEKSDYPVGFDKLGMAYYEKHEWAEAIKYFEKGTHSSARADAYAAMADYCRTEAGEPESAKTFYKKAVDEYEYLIKDYYYAWNQLDSLQRRKCLQQLSLLPKSPGEEEEQRRLARVLKKAADYCDRLSKNFFHFFCQEEITETTPSMEGYNPRYELPSQRKYLYEYQLINENNKTSETRTLLEEDGIKRNINDARLSTTHRYEKLIFGPITFLNNYWQYYYDYKILRNDTFKGEKVVVIEAIPKNWGQYNRLMGNIWIKEDENKGFDIVKLEWSPKTILENFDLVLKEEEIFKGKLSIVFFAEFEIAREGFRLPSRYYIEKSFIRGKKKTIHTITDVIFKEHRYFNVSSEVIKAEGEIKK